MKRFMFLWKYRVLLRPFLLLLVFTAALGLVQAVGSVANLETCGFNGVTCPHVGDFNPVSMDKSAPQDDWAIAKPALPLFGALVYDPDWKAIERMARQKLQRGMALRLELSPYHDNVEFQKYVFQFDTSAGWDTWNLEYVGRAKPYGDGLSLLQNIEKAKKELHEARDLYAYLAVFAPEHLFRADPYYTASLCKDPENPNPPGVGGQVQDAIIDWCNFPARMRQSVREMANLHLIFGQQFMVDAMGLHIGADFVGGEERVRQELAELHESKRQYEQAERVLVEGMSTTIGNGCYISDYYTLADWTLLMRAIENQETTQHHIAMRSSYLGISSDAAAPQAQGQALEKYRQAAVDGHTKLIVTAALTSEQVGRGCKEKGERMAGDLVASVVLRLLETHREASELRAGRNVFGFDVTFTPAQPYESSNFMGCTSTQGDRGLWDEANCAALAVKDLQAKEEANTRLYDAKQAELLDEVERIRRELNGEVGARTGCYWEEFNDDEPWYACVKEQIKELKKCKAYFSDPVQKDDQGNFLFGQFDACINASIIRDSGAQRTLLDLRSIYANFFAIKEKALEIERMITASNQANASVIDYMYATGRAETAARVTSSLVSTVSCMDPTSPWKTGACGLLGAADFVTQWIAGHMSMNLDVMMQDEEHNAEVRSLLLDQNELVVEAYSARQEYLSKESEFNSYIADAEYSLQEAQRARAYLKYSPANDASFRMVRDSSRMRLAKALDYAARLSYLAARRAEYEYAARLSASSFFISKIYSARTFEDIDGYLRALQGITDGLAGSKDYELEQQDLTISLAQHILPYGSETPEKRTELFRQWVQDHTIAETNVLSFTLALSPQEGGGLSRIIAVGYDGYWLVKLSGIDMPLNGSNGVAVNLITEEGGLSYRRVKMIQGGLVNLVSHAGCTFDYKLIEPAVMLGLEWASNQSPEEAVAIWSANVNSAHSFLENNFRTSRFLRRAALSTDWQVIIYGNSPDGILPNMDLQKLTDIQLIFSITYASRNPGKPNSADCTRFGW